MKTTSHQSGVTAIIGPPNAGKSTLLNHLLQLKIAIVTPKPQTTRNRIMGIVTGEHYQMILLDTPGLHKAREEMNRQMVRVAMESLSEADVVLFLVDATDMPPKKLDQRAEEYKSYLDKVQAPVVLALNKVDLLDPPRLLPVMEWYGKLHPFSAIVPISALEGSAVDTLTEELVKHLPEGPQYYPDDLPTDATERFIASEIIREKVFLLTRDEVPYSTAVVIDQFEEGEPVVIHATIMVERSSQKGILVGQKGRMLATIRQQSTADIEHLLGCKVQLHLWIKVRKNWSSNQNILRDLGLA
ncbi:GTPase Era [Desulfobulbus rhabdoformis]|uniref:GTPase Era n=1 Tax=Desulfobulbus rhabdoformis TaxID=34032 RepID=UPI0019627EFD|nr:GTPase Era [Desulfobulbus rhabdoformis]MBM9616199.1 GTPase Era [Desulfobulbus rhabdoformis]